MSNYELYKHCVLCPRACGANRLEGGRGFCGEDAALRIACACLHCGEEPPLTGKAGSGTVFVSGCSLRCVFCQNYQISRYGMGRALSGEEFAALCHLLQNKGAANINIVTGTHAAPAIAGGLALARAGGLCLPVLWNTSGYESLSTLSLLDDVVDVFLPDLKTLSTGRARDFFGAADYPAIAAAAVQAMIDAKPLSFSQDGALIQGVLVRHLVLPGHLDETRTVLEWFARYAQGRALLSLMTQYTPLPNRQPETEKPASLPERFVNEAEYETLLRWLEELGIEDGYYQELEPGSAWLPDFSQAEPFPGGLGRCIWHWKTDGAVALV